MRLKSEKKVLMVSPYCDPALGGVSHVVPSLVQATASGEIFIDWISTAPTETSDWEKKGSYVRQRFFARVARHDLVWSEGMIDWFKEHLVDYDLIHFHTIFSPMITRMARIAWKRKIPYWMTPHGMLEDWAFQHRGWKKKIYWNLFERPLFENAAAIQVLHAQEGESVRKRGVSSPTVVIPNGIEKVQSLSLEKIDEFWKKYPESINKKRILFLGRIHSKKGIDDLICALPWILDKIPEALLVIAGADQEGTQSRLVERATRLGVVDQILWTGHLDGVEKEAALQGADCFVLPSYSEGFSQAILEAMGRGLPCAYTNECYFSEPIDLGGAWRIRHHSEEMALNLCVILSDLSFARRCARVAQNFVMKNYLWEKIGERLRGSYFL